MTEKDAFDTLSPICLLSLPGHTARRMHQLAVALYAEEVGELNITPLQYSTLQALFNQPGMDQKTLAQHVGSDTATIGGVIDRLEARELVTREVAPHDRRARIISLTDAGKKMLGKVAPCMLRSQERFLEPLAPEKREQLMSLMRELIDTNMALSNRPAKN